MERTLATCAFPWHRLIFVCRLQPLLHYFAAQLWHIAYTVLRNKQCMRGSACVEGEAWQQHWEREYRGEIKKKSVFILCLKAASLQSRPKWFDGAFFQMLLFIQINMDWITLRKNTKGLLTGEGVTFYTTSNKRISNHISNSVSNLRKAMQFIICETVKKPTSWFDVAFWRWSLK